MDTTALNYDENATADSDPSACVYPTATNGIDDMMANASGAFQTTTGFPLAGSGSVTEFAGDGLIKPFMGGGLAVLYYLRWWIIALVVISTIVYFAYRALSTVTVKSRKGRKQ